MRDYVGEIVREDGRGRILRMASDPARLYGYNPTLVVCDEVAQWVTPILSAWRHGPAETRRQSASSRRAGSPSPSTPGRVLDARDTATGIGATLVLRIRLAGGTSITLWPAMPPEDQWTELHEDTR